MAVKPSIPTVPLSKVAAELAKKTGMTKKDASGALEDFIGLVVKHLKKGNKVRITGLGILQVRNRPARMGRNPATGEAIKIKASKKVAFRVAKHLEEAAPEPGRKIVNRARQLIGDRDKAEAWFKYQPLPAFENKTPRQLVEEGRSNAVLLHLDTLEDGVYA
jgi:DNA-binding protein HU-beta